VDISNIHRRVLRGYRTRTDTEMPQNNPCYKSPHGISHTEARGSVVGRGTVLQAEIVACSIPDEVTGFFNLPIPSGRIMALGSTQRITGMSARNLPEGKGVPARRADLTTIYESNV
jgi:hypothetical protein